jgi:hypothetical protein
MLISTTVFCTVAFLLLRDTEVHEPQRPFAVGQSEFELYLVGLGDHELVIPLTNAGTVPRQVMGIHEECGSHCCISLKYYGAVSVAPGQTFPYTVVLHVHKLGRFETGVRLYLEDNGIRAVDINVKVYTISE